MNKKDFYKALAAGGLVGILIQPVLVNIVPGASAAARTAAFLLVFLGAPAGLFAFSLLARTKPAFFQIGKFLVVGVLNTAMDAGLLNAAVYLTDIAQGWIFSAFKLASFLAAALNSFFWNKFWTFESSAPVTARETVKFYAVTIIGAVLNVSVASLLVNLIPPAGGLSLKTWDNVAVAAATIVSLVWNFAGYKLLVFKNNRE